MATFTTESNSRVLADKELNFLSKSISDRDINCYMYTDETGKKVIKLITTNVNSKNAIFIRMGDAELGTVNVNVYRNFVINQSEKNALKVIKCDSDDLSDCAEFLYNLTFADLFVGLKNEWQFNGISRISSCYPDSKSIMLTLGDFFVIEDCPGKFDLIELVQREDFVDGFKRIVEKLDKVKPLELIDKAIENC